MTSAGMDNIVDAPVTMQLTDGKDYTFSPISQDVLMGEFREWVKEQHRQSIEAVPVEYRAALYSEHVRKGVQFDELLEHVMSLDGATWLVHCALKGNHPDVKQSDVLKLVGGLERMVEVIERIAGLVPDEDGDVGEAEAASPSTS